MTSHHKNIDALLRILRMSPSLQLSNKTKQQLFAQLSSFTKNTTSTISSKEDKDVKSPQPVESTQPANISPQPTTTRHIQGQSSGANSGIAADTLQTNPSSFSSKRSRIQDKDGILLSQSLEKMMADGASWQEIRNVLRQKWHKAPSSDNSCQVTEISFLWAGISGVEEVFTWFEDFSFWKKLHHAIREKLTAEILSCHVMNGAVQYLLQHAFASWLIPKERFVVFVCLATRKEYGRILQLHNKYSQDLAAAAKDLGEQLGMTSGEFYYVIGRARMESGYYEDSLKVLRHIMPSDMAYQPAAKLKKAIYLKKKNSSSSHIHTQVMEHILSQSEWQDREGVLQYYLQQVREGHQHTPHIISVLSELLSRESFFPTNKAGDLSNFVGLCLEFVDLYDKLPNILAIFSIYAYRFLPSALDTAIWDHFLGGKLPQFSCKSWHAIALFHRFMMMGPDAQSDLFQSYSILQQPVHNTNMVVDFCFEDLKKSAIRLLRESPIHNTHAVSEMNALIDLCREDVRITFQHIDAYLNCADRPRHTLLKRLYALCISRSNKDLCGKILTQLIESGYLNNAYLVRHLEELIYTQKHDIAWRTITVLRCRMVDVSSWEALWKVSGEHRRFYHTTELELEDISKYLKGGWWHPRATRLFFALLACGHKIPQLMAIASFHYHTVRWKKPHTKSQEEAILHELATYNWLQKPVRRITQNPCHPYAPLDIPKASGNTKSRYTMLLSYLMEYLGLTCIDGNLEQLSPLATLTSSTIADEDTQNPTKKAAIRWLRSLTEHERVAWMDISSLIQRPSHEDLSSQIMHMVCALALLILPAHYDALQMMQQHMPLHYVRNLERFILSQTYSAYRIAYRIDSQVPTMPSLVQNSHKGTDIPDNIETFHRSQSNTSFEASL